MTLEDISVTPPPGAGLDATIDVTINGETFRSPANLGGDIGDRETIRLTSIDDANRFITFRAGAATIDISNGANADQLESDLKDALGFGTGGGALSFQVGSTPGDTLQVRISGVTTQKLFGGQSLDVLTQTSAGDAFNVLDDALNQVASITADVGAYQSRFSYASGNLANSITYTDEARSALADTDIASEATNFALAQLQANSAIAVLTQINGLSSNLLQLLQGKG